MSDPDFKRAACSCPAGLEDSSISPPYTRYSFPIVLPQGRGGGPIIDFKEASPAAATLERNGADFSVCPVAGARTLSQKDDFVCNLYIHNDDDTVRETLKDWDEITSLRFAQDRETGQFEGFRHVEFTETEAKDRAVTLAGTHVMDKDGLRIRTQGLRGRERRTRVWRQGEEERRQGMGGYMDGEGGGSSDTGRGRGRGGGRGGSFGAKRDIQEFSGTKMMFE